MDSRKAALDLLAKLRGGYLAFDMLDHPKAPAVKISKEELWDALRELRDEGLVASMQERLDGPLFTLSKAGRALMSEEGYAFEQEQIEKTRKLFSSYFCKTEI